MTTSFWKDIAAQLPPEIRQRYAGELKAAERFEEVLDFYIEAWGYARRALAKSGDAAAQRLRTARRLFLSH